MSTLSRRKSYFATEPKMKGQERESTAFEDKRTMLLVVLIAMSGLMGIDIHVASMPSIMHFMHTSLNCIKQSVPVYLFGLGVSLLVYGPLSDCHGRRPWVLFGLLFSSIFSILAAFSHDMTYFLVFRFFQGVGAGACAGLGRPMAVDLYNKKSLDGIRSYFSTIIGLSPLLAPVLGGYLQHIFDWQANFIFLACLFIVLSVLCFVYLPETNRHISEKRLSLSQVMSNYYYLLKQPDFIGATLIAGIGMAITITYAILSPFIFQSKYHMSPIKFGWITMAISIGVVVGRFFNGYMVRSLGHNATLILGLLSIALSGFFIFLINMFDFYSFILTIIGIFISLCGQAFARSNTMFIAMLPHKDKRGAAGAFFSGFQTLTSFLIGGLLSSIGYFFGLKALGIIYSVFGLLSLLIYFTCLSNKDSVANSTTS